jgi:hypothetical protein
MFKYPKSSETFKTFCIRNMPPVYTSVTPKLLTVFPSKMVPYIISSLIPISYVTKAPVIITPHSNPNKPPSNPRPPPPTYPIPLILNLSSIVPNRPSHSLTSPIQSPIIHLVSVTSTAIRLVCILCRFVAILFTPPLLLSHNIRCQRSHL